MSTHSPKPRPDAARPATLPPAQVLRRCQPVFDTLVEEDQASSTALESMVSRGHNASELLSLLVAKRQVTEDLISTTVMMARAQGTPLKVLAPLLGLSEDRVRKTHSPAKVLPRMEERPSTFSRHTAGLKERSQTTPAHQRLAAALTRLWKESALTQAALAMKIRVGPSYLSRLLSGDRPPSLLHVRGLATAVGREATLLEPLWYVAMNVAPGDEISAAVYLRRYLRGLHYAAGEPKYEDLEETSMLALSSLRHAFEGPGVPDWSVVDRLTSALSAEPATARPLWRAAVDDPKTITSSVPAESF